MKSSGLDPYFRIRIYAEKVGRHKPDPEAYLMACSQIRVDPASCVVFEDSGIGVAAGKRAGAAVVGVRTGYPTEDLSPADLVVPDLASGMEEVVRFIEEEKCR
jgi:sugar-phosphatase